jgi:hypothetical protein
MSIGLNLTEDVVAERKSTKGDDGGPAKEDRKVVATTENATQPIAVKPGEAVRIVIPRPPIFSG